MKTFPEKRIRAWETARKRVRVLPPPCHLIARGWRSWRDEREAGQEEDACAPWPRGRFRAATCAPTLALSLSPFLVPSLFHPPVESTAASHIYKGSLGIATLRIITAVTCEPLNTRLSLSLSSSETLITLKNSNPVSSTICFLYTLHVLLCPPYSPFCFLLLFD